MTETIQFLVKHGLLFGAILLQRMGLPREYRCARAYICFVNPPIPRQRFLIGFELREKLDPSKNSVGQVSRQLARRSHDSIQPKRHRGVRAEHLQVNVARIGLLRLLDEVFEILRGRGFRGEVNNFCGGCFAHYDLDNGKSDLFRSTYSRRFQID